MNVHSPLSKADTTDNTPSILVVTGSVGAGHNQAARALHEQFRRSWPDARLELVDVLEFTSKLFRLRYMKAYHFFVTHFPRIYGWGFWWSDRPNGEKRTLLERRRIFFERWALRRFGKFVAEFQPDIIVHTHFLAPPYLDRMRKVGQIHARQYSAVTDIGVHRWWYCERMEHYFVAQPLAAKRIRQFDVPEERITVSGMPVHPKWVEPTPTRDEILKTWNLPDRPIVILSGGTEFTLGPIVDIARRTLASCKDIALVVLGGRNKILLGELSMMEETRQGRLIPIGFTDRLPELAAVADLMITKAGGLMTAECLAKGLPMVFMKPLPGQEKTNAEFLQAHGAGVMTYSLDELVTRVSEIMNDTSRRRAMADAARALYYPGCQNIVEQILADWQKKSSKPNAE